MEIVQTVPQADCDRLLERQYQARIWLKRCPYRKLLNTRWRRFYARSGDIVRMGRP